MNVQHKNQKYPVQLFFYKSSLKVTLVQSNKMYPLLEKHFITLFIVYAYLYIIVLV